MQNFTNQYSLSKTLKFELRPIGKDGERLTEEESAELFKDILEQDRKIKEAYIALKPVIDKIHEDIINTSLTSDEEAKVINFSAYFKEYEKGKDKNLDSCEKNLRKTIGETFEKTANEFANNANKQNEEIENQIKNKKETKPVFKKNNKNDVGIKYLTQPGILKYIENNIKNLVSEEDVKKFIDIIKTTDKKGKEKTEKTGYLAIFNGFFSYFSGYNQNRKNYYFSEKESATAVATRIVHENLPKFCDNTIQFSTKDAEYLKTLSYLKDNDPTTQIKDAENNKTIEAESIKKDWFEISKFSKLLTQQGIEEYNKAIGHYNLLINLYNQARNKENDFTKLKPFKTLYKQIGCGEKKTLFNALKYDTKKEQEKANETSKEPINLQEILELVKNAGEKYFKKSDKETTIYSFIECLKQRGKNKDWNGVYWSKTAIDKISNKYLENWHEIKDYIQNILQSKEKDKSSQKTSLKSVASYNKKREEPLKINDAVELSGLFDILDQKLENGWTKTFFKESVLEEKKSLIDENLTPSQNIINLICADIEYFAQEFCKKSSCISDIHDYKNEENILTIKDWLDKAKSVLWLIKYFDVKENKVKGSVIDPEVTNMLYALLKNDDADWFNWYDLVRNYLTKKPQDDAKKNKLKLNFKNPILLGGWSDGEEKNKGAVLIKNGNKKYIGLLMKRNIFDNKSRNEVYSNEETGAGRLILKNLSFKTLAGKGFAGFNNNEKYSNIGKRNPQEAINKLQEFLKGYLIPKDKVTYVEKYPFLKDISEKKYNDKTLFDKELQKVLNNGYENNFTPICWKKVLEFVKDEKMYLFEIYSKDFSETKGDKSKNSNLNLQTKYWEHVFQNKSTIQLNGGGEIFFREKVELKNEDIAKHSANQPIYRRSDKEKKSIFKHEIIKNKRFITNKYFFHVPVKINYSASVQGIREGKPNPQAIKIINEAVNKNFTKADNIQFLGIDRGEKHLIYYSLIDAKGKIIDQNHLDIINKKDYLKEINEVAEKRRKKQENWQQKGNISNLKDGYISLVIHEIIQKMKDKDGNYKPTFIVLEDLNTAFKRSRQKFEQQVYQKFELALAKKLNYLVDKKAPIGETTPINALQLTPPITNYGDIENRKQLGIMLYTRANYTSVTDPTTGWRKTIYLKKGSEQEIKEQILKEFDDIGVNSEGDYFFQYEDKNTEKTWMLWSGKNGKSLERYRAIRENDKKEYIIKHIDINKILTGLFKEFDKSQSLKQQISNGKELQKINEHTAWETLRFAIDIIQQIRNSGGVEKDNFLHSPVRNEMGEHFDSRIHEKLFEEQKYAELPKDADANGAYNIARKGIIMYEHIKKWINEGEPKFKTQSTKGDKKDKKELSDLDLFISDKEWDLWMTNRKKWQEDIRNFSSRTKKDQDNKKEKDDLAS